MLRENEQALNDIISINACNTFSTPDTIHMLPYNTTLLVVAVIRCNVFGDTTFFYPCQVYFEQKKLLFISYDIIIH